MRLHKTLFAKRILSVLLCAVCLTSAIFVPQPQKIAAKEAQYNEPNVRVGLYVDAPLLDTREFSSRLSSSDGFEIGYSDGDCFTKLFSVSNREIIILPMTNAKLSGGKCTPSDSGNVGAYSAIIGKHSSFSAAQSSALSHGGFVASVKGGYEVRAYSGTSVASVKSVCGGRNVASPAAGGIMAIDSSNGKILFTLEDSSKTYAVRSSGGGSTNLPVMHRSGAVNSFDYLGFFEFTVSEGELWMVNVLGLEDYTKCVMANEIGTNFSVETRKAFAVLARTVPLNSKHRKQGFDVCANSACCQVYYGLHRMSEENNKIVEATKGLVCTYQGAPIAVLYHNSNGGASCSSVAAWGGNEVPYLTTVFQEETEDSDRWEKLFSKQEFYDYLKSRRTFAKLQDSDISMEIVATDPYGSDYITLLSVKDGSGNTVVVETSEDVRSACGFSSANFTVEYSTEMKVLTSNGTVETKTVKGVMAAEGYKPFTSFGESYHTSDGGTIAPQSVKINGVGVGHGVGFSATGSEKLAKDGYSYKYILSCFFNGTKLTYAK